MAGGLAAGLFGARTATAADAPRLIDVHHHVMPPMRVDAVKRA
jgi:hypothetical protein